MLVSTNASSSSLHYQAFSPLEMNPFVTYPFLKDIWMPELASIAFEAYEEEAIEMKENIPSLSGEAFLICLGKEIIGLTGYFPLDDTDEKVALRWHGILPHYQGRGFSKAAIEYVKSRLETQPKINTLVEFMPVISEYEPISKYFLKLGFVKSGAPEVVEWSEHKWQNYHLPLSPSPSIKTKLKK